MHKLFSLIFLLIALMASTVVISATEANIYSGVDTGPETVVWQETQENSIWSYAAHVVSESENQVDGLAAGGESIPDEATDNDSLYDDYNSDQINSNPDDNQASENNEDNYISNDSDNDADDSMDDSTVNGDPGDSNEVPEGLPENQETVPPASSEHYNLVISNFPNTVTPIGQSPMAGSSQVWLGDSISLNAGMVPDVNFLGWAYYPVVSGEFVQFISASDIYTYTIARSETHIVAVWDKDADGLGVQQNTNIITVTNYPVTVIPIGQSPAGTTVVQDGAVVVLTAGVAEGYTFSHWSYLSSDLYGLNFENVLAANTTFQANGAVITVIANWTVSDSIYGDGQSFQITFDPNGGTWSNGDTDPLTITLPIDVYGYATTGIPLPEDPVRPGYTFIGWNTQPDGGGEWFFTNDNIPGVNESEVIFPEMDGEITVA